MSVSRMEKIYILGHLSIRYSLIDELKKLGIIEIFAFDSDEKGNFISKIEVSSVEIDEYLTKLEFLNDFSSKYYKKPSFLNKLFNPLIILTNSELKGLLDNPNIETTYAYIKEIDDSINRFNSQIEKNRSLINELIPWKNLNAPLESLKDSQKAGIIYGAGKKNRFFSIISELKNKHSNIEYKIISEEKDLIYFLAICLKEDLPEISTQLKEKEVVVVDFDGIVGIPKQIISNLNSDIKKMKSELNEQIGLAIDFSNKEKNKILILIDSINEERQKYLAIKGLGHTEKTFVIEGWIREKDKELAIKTIHQKFSEIIVQTRKPLENEKVPVSLENRKTFDPFEFITTLHSKPNYKEIDPTPLFAPFFVLFFAFCLSDSGYGITLSALTALALIFLKLSDGVKKLLKVIFVCGISTGVIGLLFGGFFGIDTPKIFEPLKNLVLINPVAEPLKLLNVALLIGAFQLIFGISIRMYLNLKDKKYFDAIFDQFLWIIFLIALAVIGYQAILGGTVREDMMGIAKKIALSCAILVALTGGRNQKKIYLKPLMGFVKLYDVVGYFGDTLSYARLLALGLAGSAIAITVNSIARDMLSFPYYLGYIGAGVVIIIGHIFNISISALGAFVHSMRLQYLEFFSKFYSGGGREFKPFKEERKYSVILDKKD